MANPSSVGVDDNYPAVALVKGVGPARITLTIDPDKTYHVFHDKETAAGVASSDELYIMTGITGPTAAAAASKAKLRPGRKVIVGPGITTLYITGGACDCTVTIVPLGTSFGQR